LKGAEKSRRPADYCRSVDKCIPFSAVEVDKLLSTDSFYEQIEHTDANSEDPEDILNETAFAQIDFSNNRKNSNLEER
jgi:hypothetical protein